MKTSQAFDGQDPSFTQHLPHPADFYKTSVKIRRRLLQLVQRHQRESRPALGTSIGLRMKPAIRWIFVLGEALFAHREAGHGGQRPIVGNLASDGVTWAAIGAVGERITVPAIFWVAEVPQAVVAGRDVGRDGRRFSWFVDTFANYKAGVSGQRQDAMPMSMSSIRAKGGASAFKRRAKDSSSGSGPSTSMVTPADEFRT